MRWCGGCGCTRVSHSLLAVSLLFYSVLAHHSSSVMQASDGATSCTLSAGINDARRRRVRGRAALAALPISFQLVGSRLAGFFPFGPGSPPCCAATPLRRGTRRHGHAADRGTDRERRASNHQPAHRPATVEHRGGRAQSRNRTTRRQRRDAKLPPPRMRRRSTTRALGPVGSGAVYCLRDP